MRNPRLAFVLLSFIAASCRLVGDVGDGRSAGELSLEIETPAGTVACDSWPCQLDFGLISFDYESFEGTLRVTAPVEWDPVKVEGCDELWFSSNQAIDDEIANQMEFSLTLGLDEGKECAGRVILFTNAANQPADGFVLEVLAEATTAPIIDGGPCAREDLCVDDVLFLCHGVWEATDCGARDASCVDDGLCMLNLGAVCKADDRYDDDYNCGDDLTCVLSAVGEEPTCQARQPTCDDGIAAADVDDYYYGFDCNAFDASCEMVDGAERCRPNDCQTNEAFGCPWGEICVANAGCVVLDDPLAHDLCAAGYADTGDRIEHAFAYDSVESIYADCASAGAECVYNQCIRADRTCTSDGIVTCLDGRECLPSGACACESSDECPANQVCDGESGACQRVCDGDGDCEGSDICEMPSQCGSCATAFDNECDDETATSFPTCSVGTDCRDCDTPKRCYPSECASDDDCTADLKCEGNRCLADVNGHCGQDEDCMAGTTCSNGGVGQGHICVEECDSSADCDRCSAEAGVSCVCGVFGTCHD